MNTGVDLDGVGRRLGCLSMVGLVSVEPYASYDWRRAYEPTSTTISRAWLVGGDERTPPDAGETSIDAGRPFGWLPEGRRSFGPTAGLVNQTHRYYWACLVPLSWLAVVMIGVVLSVTLPAKQQPAEEWGQLNVEALGDCSAGVAGDDSKADSGYSSTSSDDLALGSA